MTSTSNTKTTATTKRPAAKANKPVVKSTVEAKSVEAAPVEPASATTQHIADQIKVFPRKRVWPD